MGKQEIYKLIRDKRRTLKELPLNIIDEYVDGFTKISSGSGKLKITYGVNVRLSRESYDNVVYPFSASFPKFNSVKAADKVIDGYKIPDFLSRFSLKEAVFRVFFSHDGTRIRVDKVSKIKILTNRLEKEWYTLNPFSKTENDTDLEEDFKTFFMESDCTFVHVNIKGLQLENEGSVYVWVCGEDPDVSANSDGSYLTNILTITNDSNKLKDFIENKRSDILEFVMLLKSRKTDDADIKQREEAIKSAKAAIMSRNMSHNLGSHVMSYLKQKLGSITSILNGNNKVLYNLIEDEKLNKTLFDKTDNNKSDIEKIKENVQLPFLVGTGRFIGYLQERQDYIATIATDYIPYGAPVNLKDAVYDELNPDLRYMRHNAEDNNRPMNILLNYIAKSEGFSRENMGIEANKDEANQEKFDDKLKYRTKNDILFGYVKYWREEVDGKITNKQETFGINESNQESDHPAMTEMRGINFSMPGGLVGRQALFSIIENLIRNAAKHGDTSGVSNLIFTFDTIPLYELDGCVSFEKRICDEKWRMLYKNASDRENLYILTITDNLKYDNSNNKVLEMLMKGLYDPYVDNSGNMTTGNKGIKEVRISAAWLRNDTNEDNYFCYDDAVLTTLPQKKAPLVAIELTEDRHLRYMICLMRDRFAAVVTDGMEDIGRFSEMKKLSPKDWEFYDSVELLKKDYKTSYRYIFVATKGKYEELRPYTSNRLVIWNLEQEKYSELNIKWNKINGNNKDKEYKEKKKLILEYLYLGLLKSSIPEGSCENVFEPIFIWDGSAAGAHEKEYVYDSMIKLSSNDSAKGSAGVDGSEEAQYVYRTHHSSEKDFMSYWKEKCLDGKYKSIKRIDAVTGDNSSDRLIRREKLDEEWYYTHLNALRKRVAVFDERIFKIVHNIDETDFVIKNPSLNYIENLLTRLNTNHEDYDIIKDSILEKKFLSGTILEEVAFIENRQELQDLLSTLLITFKHIIADNYKSIVYQERGIDLFTIIEERKGVFAVVGYVGKPDENSDMTSLSLCKYDKIATMSCEEDDNQFVVKIDFENKYKDMFINKFDYISIHQGLLDKLYEGFRIKTASDNNNPKKEVVTQMLFENFSRSACKIGNFLPNFIIHSGRAKPTKDDMPQELPFIQYAAIENAVKDCKFAFVELLDYARFDPSDN